MKRMGRKKGHFIPLSLTALMDVFTNLVFFLLMSQGVMLIDEPPKDIKLPDSFVDAKGRASVNIMVSDQTISVQGEVIAETPEVLVSQSDLIASVKERLVLIKGASTGTLDKDGNDPNTEVTILAHSEIPFKVMKKLMMTCTSAGFSKISLAVRENSGVTAPPKKF
jgi:biopolymer transport protein ExbD